MPLDECCFRCIECHNVRCLEDGDRGCIHGRPICDRCYPGDCPECQQEAETRIAELGHLHGPPQQTLRQVLADQRDYLARRKAETGFDPAGAGGAPPKNAEAQRGTP